MKKIHYTALLLSLTGYNGIISGEAYAQSSNLYGALGLNTIPSARMDETGTIRAQMGFSDPYLHSFTGVQITTPLYIGLRQSAEFSSLSTDAKHLYPGIDAKLRLHEETVSTPAIAIGVQSGVGHKRMAGEYITFSKRYKKLDFTGGIGWGRFAGRSHFDNPLKALSAHFGKDRSANDENSNKTQNWFTGEDIGLFGGLEYLTPVKDLSLKAEYSGDSFEAEKAAFNHQAASPWSLGLNYKPWSFINIGLATLGTDRVMGRIAFQKNVKNWRHQSYHNKNTIPLNPNRTASQRPADIQTEADQNNIPLSYIRADQNTAEAHLNLSANHAAPNQIGKAAIIMSNHASPSVEEIKISPFSYGLRGPSVHLIRSSLERAFAHNNGSPEEIWHTSEFKHDFSGIQKVRPQHENEQHILNTTLSLDNQFSLSEEDTGILHRTSLRIENDNLMKSKYFIGGIGLRLNLNDNISKIPDSRPRAAFPIRSDVYDFADRFLALDTAYIAFTHTPIPDLHTSIISGYVDEMFSGIGSEILYRPFDKRFALGAEGWAVQKRDPTTVMNLGTKQGNLLTAHINGWYDIPEADITLGIKAGRYLAKDFGITTSLIKNFNNGANLEAYISLSDKSDMDPYGGSTHSDHGIRLTLPLGGFKYTPNMKMNVLTAPFGRDIGQLVNNPLPLYKASEGFSMAHISKHWNELNK